MLQEDAFVTKAYQTVAVGLYAFYNSRQPAIAKGNGGALFQSTAGIDDTIPEIPFHIFEQKDLHHGASSAGLLAVEAGGQDTGIVDDQAITGNQMVENVIKMLMIDLSAVTVKGHQAGMIPL